MVNAQMPSRLRASLPQALVALSLTAAVVGCLPPPQDAETRGRIVYRNCTSCHMVDGSGDEKIGAPALSGLPQWYVEAQLHKFRTAQRGSHFEDVGGMKMRPMSLSINSEADVTAVAAHIAKMPVIRNGGSVQGDKAKGQVLFATCMACHGPAGGGNEALRAPPLAKLDDWYVLTQLKKFKAGIRGANPADLSGATMRPMAATLPDEQAMRDVIAHIQGLSK